MAEVLFRARLTRDDSATPWGFRLQGGADYKKPLTLLKVVEGSVAAKSGLHATDIVVKLAGRSADGMTHKGAQEAILASGNALEIIVERADVTLSTPPNTPQLQKANKVVVPEKRSGSPPNKVCEEGSVTEEQTAKQTQPARPHSTEPPSSLPPQDAQAAGQPQTQAQQPVSTPQVVISSASPIQTDSNLYIPDSNNNQQLAETVDLEGETFVKDPAEFQVNPFHRPGAKRSEASTNDDSPSDPSSSGSAESLDADSSSCETTDDATESLQVQEEKLLASADDTWNSTHRLKQSPVAIESPDVEWRPLDVTGGEQSVLDPSPKAASNAGVYSEVSTKVMQLTTTQIVDSQMGREIAIMEQGELDTVGKVEEQIAPAAGPELYPWRRRTSREDLEPGQLPRPQDEVVGDQCVVMSEPDHIIYPSDNRSGGAQERDDLSQGHTHGSIGSGVGQLQYKHDVQNSNTSQSAGEHVGGDDPGRQAAVVTPSLTFVGRRIAPPTTVVEETPTNKSPSSPHISVTPSSPPTGLTVLPISHQYQHTKPDHTTPSHAPSAPFDLPQLTQDMSDIQQDALRLLSNNEYHSPRIEDIHFSTGGPEVVDIPMPAVKEMVEDLNRRLEAIAAQQPKIAEPPTAQEIGLTYIRERRKELEQEQSDAEKEIFIDMVPAVGGGKDSSYGQNYFRTTESPATTTFPRMYDTCIDSSTLQPTPEGFEQRGPSPRTQRRVHFADPPEQSVIEIESRSNSRHRNREKQVLREGATALTNYNSQSLPEPLNRGQHTMPGSMSSTTGMPSLTPVTSYASSTMPVIIERPASRLSTHHPLSPPSGYNSSHPFTSSSGHAGIYPSGAQTGPSSGHHSSHPSTHPGIHQTGHPSTQPGVHPSNHPSQFSVSITHKKADQSMPTRMAFTLPSGQPGHPTHFRYTMAGTASPQQQPHHQRQSDAGLTYTLPPRYEDSIKMMGPHGYTPRSLDDSHLSPPGHPRPGQHSLMHHNSIGRAVSPQTYRQSSPLYVETAAGPLSPPRASPVYSTPRGRPGPGYISQIRGTSPFIDDATQSKSFRALEAHYTDRDRGYENSSVQVLGTPSQVLQPVAVGRPFSQSLPGFPDIRMVNPPQHVGTQPGPLGSGVDLAGAAIGPGLFALFDSGFVGIAQLPRSFTEKFMQWQQSPRSHFESETYKLVHEMEGSQREPHGGQ